MLVETFLISSILSYTLLFYFLIRLRLSHSRYRSEYYVINTYGTDVIVILFQLNTAMVLRRLRFAWVCPTQP